jgi:hypothetical protein
MYAVQAVNYISYIWNMDIVKKVLMPLNVNRYRLLEKTALSVNDLPSSTIRCPLNVNGLLHKYSVKALKVR